MKEIIVTIFVCFSMVGAIYAESALTDEDYKNMEQLRKKLVRMKREMDTFMRDIISTYPEAEKSVLEGFGEDVKVDVAENDKYFMIKADLPGMDKDKINITLENNRILKISGSRSVVAKAEGPGIIKQERAQGAFERVLELPGEGMSQGIKATYQNGVLEVLIPKKIQTKEEKIKITVL